MRVLMFRFLVSGVLLLASISGRAEMTKAWVIESSDLHATIVTTNPIERDQLLKDGWSTDGTGMMRTTWAEGAGPLHRFSRTTPKGVERILETDIQQLPVLQKAGYVDEGVVGFVADSDGPARIPVIQFRKGNRKVWVISEAAQSRIKQEGWTRQGIHFWLWPVTKK